MKARPPAFIINNQPVSGSVWQRLVNAAGPERAPMLLYKARRADNVVRYIQAMVANRWFEVPVDAEDPRVISRWMDTVIVKAAAKPQQVVTRRINTTAMDSVGAVLARMTGGA